MTTYQAALDDGSRLYIRRDDTDPSGRWEISRFGVLWEPLGKLETRYVRAARLAAVKLGHEAEVVFVSPLKATEATAT